MRERVKVVPNGIKSLWNAIGNTSMGAVFGHKGYESKKPKFGTLQMGGNVLTKDGKLIKAEEVSESVRLGDKVIVYFDTNDRNEDPLPNK